VPDSESAKGQRNRQRAYDENGNELPPLTLGNMREHGIRSIDAYC
jgi:hypothetical protein